MRITETPVYRQSKYDQIQTSDLTRSASSVSRQQVGDAMNARPRSARPASGGEEFLFEDALNYLRSHVRALTNSPQAEQKFPLRPAASQRTFAFTKSR